MNSKQIIDLSQEQIKELGTFYDEAPFNVCVLKYEVDEDGTELFVPVYCNAPFLKMFPKNEKNVFRLGGENIRVASKLHHDLKFLKKVAFENQIVDLEDYDVVYQRFFKCHIVPYKYGFALTFLQDVTDKRLQGDALASIVTLYREISYLRLDLDEYQIIYPEEKMTEMKKGFDEATKNRLENGMIESVDFQRVKKILSIDYLRQELRSKNSVECKYRRLGPNNVMEWCLVTATCIERLNGIPVSATLSIRSIDAMVKENEDKKLFLERKNQDLREKMEIIDSLTNIYYAVYHIDLIHNYYKEIASLDKIKRFIPFVGEADTGLRKMCEALIVSDYNQEMKKFTDLSTLPTRMKDKNIVSHEFMGVESGWSRGSFVVSKRDDKGHVIEVLYVAQHIDEEKQKELTYQRSLEEAYELSLNANMTRSKFLTSMSHDIRTPINGILGMIKKDDESACSEEQHKEHMKKIRASAEQLLSIMTDVLEMSKLESGSTSLSVDNFNLLDAVEAVKSVEEGEGIQFTLDYQVEHSEVVGSQYHIRQLLSNVIKNAHKFNKKDGKVKMSVSENSNNDNTSVYRFIIEDTGIGMSQDFLPHIFEPFTQENGRARTTFEGTGLGMAIVKRLVDEMDGNITVDSKLGVGTKVTIDLPLGIKDVKQGGEIEDCSKVNVSGMRALLVEDNEINMEIAQFILESADIEVVPAVNGKIALDTFEHSKVGEFDMILMDIMMPVMDGLQAAKEIRMLNRKDAKDVPIIAVTANTFPEDVKKSMDAGMNEHIGKPIDSDILINTIKKCKLHQVG